MNLSKDREKVIVAFVHPWSMHVYTEKCSVEFVIFHSLLSLLTAVEYLAQASKEIV